MADVIYRFRSALGGFHKGDVTGFIEKTLTQHRSELLERDQIIHTLQEENRSLQQQLNLLMMATPVTESAPTPAPAPVPKPEPTPVVESKPVELMSLELQAYRRAEAVERNANKRAQQLYQQMDDVCQDTLGKFQLTDSAMKDTIALLLEQANSLEQAYQALSASLTSSRQKLAASNPLLYEKTEDPE